MKLYTFNDILYVTIIYVAILGFGIWVWHISPITSLLIIIIFLLVFTAVLYVDYNDRRNTKRKINTINKLKRLLDKKFKFYNNHNVKLTITCELYYTVLNNNIKFDNRVSILIFEYDYIPSSMLEYKIEFIEIDDDKIETFQDLYV